MKVDIKKNVRETYGKIASKGGSCCSSSNSCCSPQSSCCGLVESGDSASKLIGYSDDELRVIPAGADLGLGCGNPVALASLKEGDIVLDLGSGAGIDCFLAAERVGKTGKVIGVDMTPEMLEKARQNATTGNYGNVEFRLGEIENLPVADKSIDVVISNCVINLCPDKDRVFREVYRVLKKGGRLMVSDIVLDKTLPEDLKDSTEAYCGCIAGASMKSDYIQIIKVAGFKNVKIAGENTSYINPIDYQNEIECDTNSGCNCDGLNNPFPIISVKISANKPK